MNFSGGKYSNIVTILILFSLLLAAALIRGPDLGKWCFTTDEFYTYQSVSNIIEKGVPRFSSGGYYVRGIGFQYLSALPVLLLEKKEFAIRLLPYLFGILTIPLFYLICRKFLPLIPAIFCSSLLLLSSWHIEFSRFGRFYTPFQFIFLLFVYFFYSGYWCGIKNNKIYCLVFALIAIFIFEGSIFLTFLLLIPLTKEDSFLNKNNIELLSAFIIILTVNYLVNGISYSNIGVVNRLPLDIVSSGTKSTVLNLPVVIPPTELLSEVIFSPFFAVCYIFIFCFGGYLFFQQMQSGKNFWQLSSIFLSIILPLFHQYALVGGILVLLSICRNDVLKIYMGKKRIWLVYFLSTLTFWTVVIVLSGRQSQTLHYLVGYPPIKYSIIRPFLETVPLWSFMVTGVILITLFHIFYDNNNKKEQKFLIAIILMCIMILPIFKTPYKLTRYSFFYFPLLFIISYIEIVHFTIWIKKNSQNDIIKKLSSVLIFLPLLLFMRTEDFNIEHITNVSKNEINFRLGNYAIMEHHWQERFDYESLAYYINNVYKDGDKVVIDSIPFAFYLKNPFTFFSQTDTPWFNHFSRNLGKEEKWTGHPMVSSITSIVDLIPSNSEKCLWLISKEGIGETNVFNISRDFNLILSLESVGIDGRFKVWRITRHAG